MLRKLNLIFSIVAEIGENACSHKIFTLSRFISIRECLVSKIYFKDREQITKITNDFQITDLNFDVILFHTYCTFCNVLSVHH